jgi:hypothetical protein
VHSTIPATDLKLTTRWLTVALAATLAMVARAADVAQHPPARTTPSALSQVDAAALIELELYEAALAAIGRPSDANPRQRATLECRARIGLADDHYLARNLQQALRLYESSLAGGSQVPAGVRKRWAICLALILGELDSERPAGTDAVERLRGRVQRSGVEDAHPVLGKVIEGFLAEQSRQRGRAIMAFAAAIGDEADVTQVRDLAAYRALRRQVVSLVRDIYTRTPVERRMGIWEVSLPGLSETRRTRNFEVRAAHDVVARRVAEAAEFHLRRVGDWLGFAADSTWAPRCEIRVHPTLAALHAATDTSGATRALSRTDLKGREVTARVLHVFQSDPWLLSSTLPHELTHLLIAERCRHEGPPLAIDEGLALLAEPDARRRMYARLLTGRAPTAASLLERERLPADIAAFYAESGVLTAFLLHWLDQQPHEPGPPAVRLLDHFRDWEGRRWWTAFGYERLDALETAWLHYRAARCVQDAPALPDLLAPQPGTRALLDGAEDR